MNTIFVVVNACCNSPFSRSTTNHHLLRAVATAGQGSYQYYDSSTKSKWEAKVGQIFTEKINSGYPLHRKNGENDRKYSVLENTGNLKFCQNIGKTGNFVQVVNSLILNIKNIAIILMFF